MEDLISLVKFVSRQKTHQINVVDELTDTTSKVSSLYTKIETGQVKSDKDALELIYNDKGTYGKLSKLKSRLFQKLVNSVFFIDQNESRYSDKLNAAKNCYRNYAALKLLLGNQRRSVAVKIAEQTLKYSRKYDFTDLNYLITSFLTNHFVSQSLEKKKYLKYKKLRQYYLMALEGENEIEEMQGKFNMALSSSSSERQMLDLREYSENISSIRENQKHIFTQRYNLYAYLYQINLYLELKKYDKILDLAEEGLSFFKKLEIGSIDATFMLTMRLGLANFMLKNYREAKTNFENNVILTKEYPINYFSTLNYYFSLFMIQRKYQQVYEVCVSALNSDNFKRAHPLTIQLFKIKEAYIHFLVELGKVDPAKSSEKPLRKFRLNRFLNDVPTYSKDKRGVNISILIIQMILLVQNKKHGEIIDKLDALNMYSHRYLRSDNTFRSNCFIKMLAKLPDADYHPIRWERYVKKFRDRLEEHPFELSYHNLDLEVIPFETLYDLVVEMLYQQKGIDMPT